MTTTPVEKDPSPSKTGAKLIPALLVFQTPPAAVATYQIRLSTGCTATSATRPEVRAGPMARKLRPAAAVANLTESVLAVSAAGLAWATRGAAAPRARARSVRMGR